MPQLDALRAFAVGAVIFFHFYQAGRGPFGHWGVQLFFVLSGFLITGILLRCRSANDLRFELRQFYVRRALRIFPLFYFVVLASAVLNIGAIRSSMPWHLAYLSNVYMSVRGEWDGPFAHFWSLAVEEQFYLFWPCLMLFVSRKYVLPVMVAATLVAPAYKGIAVFLQLNDIAVTTITLGCLDSLGIGAILAYWRFTAPLQFERAASSRRYRAAGFVILVVVLAGWNAARGGHPVINIVNDLTASLLFAWFVHSAAVGVEGWAGRVLSARPLLQLGKISYGLYVYHNLMPTLVPMALRSVGLPTPHDPILKLLVFTMATVGIASVSWVALERPINALKRRFKYSSQRLETTRRASLAALPSA